VDSDAARETLLKFSSILGDSEPAAEALHPQAANRASAPAPGAPIVAVSPGGLLPSPEEAETLFSCRVFDRILAREPWRRTGAGKAIFDAFAAATAKLLAPEGEISLLQSPPRLGQRISGILAGECHDSPSPGTVSSRSMTLSEKIARAEEEFFNASNKGNSDEPSSNRLQTVKWDEKTLEKSFKDAGFAVSLTVLDQSEERLILPKDLSLWFDIEKSSWGAFMAVSLGEKDFSEIRDILENRVKEGPVMWKWKSLLLKAVKKQ